MKMESLLCKKCIDIKLDAYLDSDLSENNYIYEGENVIHILASHGHLEALKRVLNQHTSINIDCQDEYGWTAVMFAIDSGHISLAEYLIKDKQADVTKTTLASNTLNGFHVLEAGSNALHMAIQVRNNVLSGCIEWSESAGQDLFHLIQILVEFGTKLDDATVRGRTPLLTAIHFGGQVDVIEFLLANNVSMETEDARGLTPFLDAVYQGNTAVVGSLLHRGANSKATHTGQTALHIASELGSSELIEILLNAGLTVECRDSLGDTPLHTAINASQLKAVQQLLKRGANPELKTDPSCLALSDSLKEQFPAFAEICTMNNSAYGGHTDGYTALQLTTFLEQTSTNMEIVNELISVGANPEARTSSGKTALLLAIIQGKIEFANILLANGADMNTIDNNGWNALMLACKKLDHKKEKHLDFLQRLINNTIDIYLRDKCGNTALHVACEEKQANFVRLLFEAGLKIDHSEAEIMPLELAIQNYDIRTIVVCLQAGTNISPSVRYDFEDELEEIERKLLQRHHLHSLCILLETGYRFHYDKIMDAIDLTHHAYIENVERLFKALSEPLSLKRQSANILRRSLTPNVFVAVSFLPFPPGVALKLSNYILMENVM